MSSQAVRHARADFRWDEVECLEYKDAGSAPFRDVTRQVLFEQVGGGTQWRYFEVAAGGWSTLERHQHTHAVMVLRGRGRCLVDGEIVSVGERDLVEIKPMTWHQFRADPDSPLGFLCLVSTDRDRPQLPDAQQLAQLRRDPQIDAFLEGQ